MKPSAAAMKRRTPTIWVPSRKWWPRRIGRCAASGASESGMSGSTPFAKRPTTDACRDQCSGATERRNHGGAAGRGNALRGREGGKSESQGLRARRRHEAHTLKFRAPSAGTVCGTAEKDEARGCDQDECGGEHEVVEALALAKTAVDEVRHQKGDERRRGLEGDVELRARVSEREARDEACGRRQRGRSPRERQSEEPKAHSKEEIGTPSPSA
jgi:hypothetical protein